MTDRDTARPVGVVSVLAFVAELTMLALLAWAGWRLGAGRTGLRWVAAVGLPSVGALVWGRWMAPTSSTRLEDPWRLVSQAALFAATGALLAAAGQALWGVGFAILATAVFAGNRVIA